MNERIGVLGLGVSLALVLGACAGGNDGDDFDIDDGIAFRTLDAGSGDLSGGEETEASKGTPPGGWLGNGLEDPSASGVDPAYGLDSEQGLSSTGLVADPTTRKSIEYLVECALADGDSVTKTIDGVPTDFHGLLGLATEWKSGSCDEDCQQWVSACMLARTNVSGTTVTIWVQGNHTALGFGLPESGTPILEAGFYGNLFAGPDEKFYCKGAPTGNVAATREGRTCSGGSNDCEFEKFNSCDGRCDLLGPDLDVPSNCVPGNGSSTGSAYHTIATYIVQ